MAGSLVGAIVTMAGGLVGAIVTMAGGLLFGAGHYSW